MCDDGMSGDRIVSVTPAARGRRRRDEGNSFVRSFVTPTPSTEHRARTRDVDSLDIDEGN